MKKTKLYIASVILLVIGVVTSAVFIFQSYSQLGTAMEQVVLPGNGEFELKKDGSYTFYHEYKSTVDGEKINNKDATLDGYEFSLANKGTGDEAELQALDGKKTYSFRDREGRTLFEAFVKEPGTYVMSAVEKPGVSGPEVDRFVVTLDRGFLVERLKSILGGQIIMLIPALLALIIFIYAYPRKQG